MTVRRRAAAVTALTLALTGVAGCGGDDGGDASVDGLTVSGTFGEEPTVDVDGLDVEDVESTVVVEGDGEELTAEGAALYRFIIAKGTDGEVVASNYRDNEPRKMIVADEPEVVADAVTGEKIGSRVAIAMPVRELLGEQGAPQVGLTADDDLVMVFDLIETAEPPVPPLEGPEGKEVEPPADAPTILEEDGAISGLDFSGAPKADPKAFQVIPLVEGEGAKVANGDPVTLNYIGTRWGVGDKLFDNSYERGQPAEFTITAGGLIDGWVKGLVGVRVGSRVMLVIPPKLGYGEQGNPEIKVTGDDTLVFVIDVLGIG